MGQNVSSFLRGLNIVSLLFCRRNMRSVLFGLTRSSVSASKCSMILQCVHTFSDYSINHAVLYLRLMLSKEIQFLLHMFCMDKRLVSV